jgi:hydrogenase nickel incorporation protein HypA/HybF
MHELSIATQLVDQVLAAADANDAVRVDVVRIDIGAMQLVVPEAMRVAFEASVEGTIAAHAVLEIKEVEAKGKCRECGHEFAPQIGNYMCPECLKANTEIIQGRDVILASLECITNEELEHGKG